MRVNVSLSDVMFLAKASAGLADSAEHLATENNENWRLVSAMHWRSIASACAEAIKRIEAAADKD